MGWVSLGWGRMGWVSPAGSKISPEAMEECFAATKPINDSRQMMAIGEDSKGVSELKGVTYAQTERQRETRTYRHTYM